MAPAREKTTNESDGVDLSVVVVSWNTCDLLAACLESVVASVGEDTSLQIVVVDNASSDGSVEMVRRRWPSVDLIANEENLGYQRASNQAIERCTGRELLLINADAALRPGCLQGLRARLAADPRAAVVGPRLAYADGSWQRWTAGHRLDVTATAVSMFGLDRLFPRRGAWLGRDIRVAFNPGWVSSACMLVRRAALDDIGPMDERFFAYMDDVDLCERAVAAGWRVWYEPDADCMHVMGASSRRQTGTTSALALRNLYRYIDIHRGRRAAVAARVAGTAGFAARAATHRLLGIRTPAHKPAARAHWRNALIGLERLGEVS